MPQSRGAVVSGAVSRKSEGALAGPKRMSKEERRRQLMETATQFADTVQSASNTDITGGVLQAVEWLKEVEPGRKTILIFSDMEEDLPAGYVRDFPIELAGVEVIALNVTKLRPDNVDPREYLSRLEEWRRRVEAGGGRRFIGQ